MCRVRISRFGVHSLAMTRLDSAGSILMEKDVAIAQVDKEKERKSNIG